MNWLKVKLDLRSGRFSADLVKDFALWKQFTKGKHYIDAEEYELALSEAGKHGYGFEVIEKFKLVR